MYTVVIRRRNSKGLSEKIEGPFEDINEAYAVIEKDVIFLAQDNRSLRESYQIQENPAHKELTFETFGLRVKYKVVASEDELPTARCGRCGYETKLFFDRI